MLVHNLHNAMSKDGRVNASLPGYRTPEGMSIPYKHSRVNGISSVSGDAIVQLIDNETDREGEVKSLRLFAS